MKKRSVMAFIGSAALVALGFVLGQIQTPSLAHAQEAETDFASEPFVVVPGYPGSSKTTAYYFVVSADGSATRVKENGKAIQAPQQNQAKQVIELEDIELKHTFGRSPSIKIDHSGRIAK